jgi:hypothetical protein
MALCGHLKMVTHNPDTSKTRHLWHRDAGARSAGAAGGADVPGPSPPSPWTRGLGASHRVRLGHRELQVASFLRAVAEALSPQRFREENATGCEIYLTLLSLATCIRLYSSIPRRVCLQQPRARTHGFTGVLLTVPGRSLKRAMKFSVAGVFASFCAALALNDPELRRRTSRLLVSLPFGNKEETHAHTPRRSVQRT